MARALAWLVLPAVGAAVACGTPGGTASVVDGGAIADDGGTGSGGRLDGALDGARSDASDAAAPVACPAPGPVPPTAPASACTGAGFGDDLVAWHGAAERALGGFFDTSTGRFGTAWWTAANALEAAETTYERTGGAAGGYFFVATHALVAPDSAYINDYYDDEGWWANAWVHAYDVTGDAAYLATARSIFDDIKGGWDGTCNGGVWWSKARTYKNAIPNELFLLLAASLHDRTPGDAGAGSYLDWAKKEWAWFDASGMIGAKHLVNDGLTAACANNGGTTWTYNQGVVLAGLVELRRATGDDSLVGRAEAIADAALATLTDANGILVEPCTSCGGDGPQFKGIFARSLERLYEVDRKPAYGDFLARNARSIWTKDRDAQDHLGLLWQGPFDSADVTRHNSGMVALGAAAPTTTAAAPLLRASGDRSFCHPIGVATGTAAWACDAAACPAAGYMQTGPAVTYLPAGAHTAHVRLAVDALRAGSCVLAAVEVRSASDGGVPLAHREVAWQDFAAAGEATDFALPYVVGAAGDAVDVRVYWHAQPGAPRLTVSDVAVDAPHAWTGANLAHDVGRLDVKGAWTADPVADPAPGLLAHGPGTTELAAGPSTAFFELAVDAFGATPGTIATVAVVDDATGQPLATRDLARADFRSVLYQPIAVPFTAPAGHPIDFTVRWAGAGAPRVSLRGVAVLQGGRAAVKLPFDTRGIGTSAGDANLDGLGYALASSWLPAAPTIGLRSYALGPTTAGAVNVLAANGQTIPLPAGTFRAVRLLALATNGTQAAQPFVVAYTDGSTTTTTRSISDWFAALPQVDERVALTMPARWTASGAGYGDVHVYEVVLPLDAGKTAASLKLPAAPHVKLLAATMEGSD